MTAPAFPDGVINLSDPDSRVMRTQGTLPRKPYNAQTAVNDQQVILGRGDQHRRAGLQASRQQMRDKLTRELGRRLYAQRKNAEGDKVVATTPELGGGAAEGADVMTFNDAGKLVTFEALGDTRLHDRVFAK